MSQDSNGKDHVVARVVGAILLVQGIAAIASYYEATHPASFSPFPVFADMYLGLRLLGLTFGSAMIVFGDRLGYVTDARGRQVVTPLWLLVFGACVLLALLLSLGLEALWAPAARSLPMR